MSEDVRVVALIEAKHGEESAVQQACEACVGPTRQEAGCDMYVYTAIAKIPHSSCSSSTGRAGAR